MKVVSTLDELRSAKSDLPALLGLVPTMGFLHEGHLSLIKKAKAECESVGASIFVNPTQFGEGEDLGAYPRDLPRDLRLLEEEGVDLVWVPAVEDVYPTDSQTWVVVEELTKQLEGRQRPGHFRGVTTVVAKLFNAFQPDRAYFGQKDAQQTLVIQRMAKELLFPVEIVVCPIVREDDGLAMSSRNTYLDPDQRRAAIVLQNALREAAERFKFGERDAEVLRGSMLAVIQGESLARAQYISVADPNTLEEIQGEIQCALLSMAVYVGETRLIDNMVVGLD
ncbi:MAG: pantoate--beta-alanine ligase [Anaerolineales bacterium]|nr:pantoate--beta-alanine ligase [Anaerolineales bacterium]